jgi:hypothetical protein
VETSSCRYRFALYHVVVDVNQLVGLCVLDKSDANTTMGR